LEINRTVVVPFSKKNILFLFTFPVGERLGSYDFCSQKAASYLLLCSFSLAADACTAAFARPHCSSVSFASPAHVLGAARWCPPSIPMVWPVM
jgi:hypothetical protein